MIVNIFVLKVAAFHHTTSLYSLPCFPTLIMGTVHRFPLLSFVFNTSASLLFPLYEGSSSLLSSAAAFNVVGKLSLLGRSGTIVSFDFSVPTVMVSGSDLQLETCYGVVASSYLLSTKTVCPLNWQLLL